MFNQTFVEEKNPGARLWTVAASLAMQSAAICAAVIASLVFGLELPIDQLMRQALIFVPPPPPAARPALPKAQAAIVRPTRFRADVLQVPRAIPDQVAIIDDAHDSAALASLDFSGLNGVAGGVPGGLINGIIGVPGLGSNVPPPPPPLRIGGRVLAAKLLQQVPPVYPEEAVNEDISGTVYLEATIGKLGSIRKLKVLSGNPVLAEAAVEAVQKWRYRPTLLNGSAVEVISQIEVIFALRLPEEDTSKDANRKKKPKSK